MVKERNQKWKKTLLPTHGLLFALELDALNTTDEN
jgi:hypothetical protein